jgi:adenylate kinase
MQSEAKKCVVIFIGPPGCGKGTQAGLLVEKLGFASFSAGDELRKEIASGSDLGQEISKICDAGGLVPDDVVNTMAKKFIDTASGDRLLFDGFPRKVPQAEFLRDAIPGHWPVCACSFRIDDELVIERILCRFSCAKCGYIYNSKTRMPTVEGKCDFCGSTDFTRRNDDNEESMRQRLNNYKTVTNPMLALFSELGILHEVDASCEVPAVSQRIADLTGVLLEKI